ncbi:MAG: peroxidase [Planctomycetes bacterium]|nr:peroxidase [Planctomycetota bacterium]
MQEPIYLPEVEKALPPGERAEMMRRGQAAGEAVPQIYHLFAYKLQRSKHLANFTQGVMRGPSPLSHGLRELIAAYTSRLNTCHY